MGRGIAATTLLSWALMALPCHAQKTAKDHFDRGVELSKKGDHEGALVEFRAAYEAEPHYKVKYNIGVSLYKLNRYLESKEELETYLSEGGSEIPEETRTEIKAILFEIMTYIGTLEIVCDIDGAEVRLDGLPVGTTPLSGPLQLDVGEHEVEVEAEGYAVFSRAVSVPGGTVTQLEVTLGDVEEEPPPVEEEEVEFEPAPEKPSLGKAVGRSLFLTGLGLSIVQTLALPVASIFYIVNDRAMKTYLVPSIAWGGVLSTSMILGSQIIASRSLKSLGVKEPKLIWSVRAAGWVFWGITVLEITAHYLLQGLHNYYDDALSSCAPDECDDKRSFRNAFATATHFWSGLLTGMTALTWALGTVGWVFIASEVRDVLEGEEESSSRRPLLTPWIATTRGGAVLGIGGAF